MTREGAPLERRGDTYSSLETVSEDSEPESDGVMVERLVPSRAGLPLTEAIGRLASRLERVDRELGYHRRVIAMLIGAVLALAAVDAGAAVVAVTIWAIR